MNGVDARACFDGPDRAARVGRLAHRALLDELETWPKPGLVSPVDAGSHADMDASTLRCSADAIRPFFAEMARAGAAGARLAELRTLGLVAEAAMLKATQGVNSHRGAIFSLGLVCAAEGARDHAPGTAEARACDVGVRWGGAILSVPAPVLTNGGRAARRFSVGGAREEAAAGFPTVRRIGLPALREGQRLRPDDLNAARVQCLFALMAAVDDTNLLHRGGLEALVFAQSSASAFIEAGGVGAAGWCEGAERVHRTFVARRLSPGGSADLLALALFLHALEVGAD